MASIKKYKTAKATAWRVQYRSPDGKSRTKQGFRTKVEAEAWAAKNTVTINYGEWLDPAKGKIKVEEIGERWLKSQTHLKPKTLHETKGLWSRYVLPEWGQRHVSSIKQSEVQEWVATLGKSGSTVRQAHSVLAKVLDLAVADWAIRVNPARDVALPRKGKAVKVYLTAEQLKLLADKCTRYGEIVWVLGTVGLRWGELAALRVRDVNQVRCRLNINRSVVAFKDEVHIGLPKTHEVRSVAVPPSVMAMLVPLLEGKGPDDLLWSRPDGDPLRVPTQTDWFGIAVKRLMSDEELDFPYVSPHGLRHVAAGLMVSAGANVLAVRNQLGHASAAMTLDVYSELWDEDLQALGVAIEEKIIPALDSSKSS